MGNTNYEILLTRSTLHCEMCNWLERHGVILFVIVAVLMSRLAVNLRIAAAFFTLTITVTIIAAICCTLRQSFSRCVRQYDRRQ